jgi:sec-independent protein translocase protein TatB
MFDLGWAELILIGIVALIVMGDDFPSLFRQLGRFTGKMRKMAREFSRAMEEAADDAGVKDISNTLKTATSRKSMGLDALDKASDAIGNWEAGRERKITPKPKTADTGDKPTTPAPSTTKSDAAEPAPEAAAEPEPQKAPDPGP